VRARSALKAQGVVAVLFHTFFALVEDNASGHFLVLAYFWRVRGGGVGELGSCPRTVFFDAFVTKKKNKCHVVTVCFHLWPIIADYSVSDLH